MVGKWLDRAVYTFLLIDHDMMVTAGYYGFHLLKTEKLHRYVHAFGRAHNLNLWQWNGINGLVVTRQKARNHMGATPRKQFAVLSDRDCLFVVLIPDSSRSPVVRLKQVRNAFVSEYHIILIDLG